MKQTKTRSTAVVIVLFVLFSCTQSGIEDIFFPNISNLWFSDQRNATYTLKPAKENVSESTFTGVEHDNNTAEDHDLSGSFKNYDISFTFSNGPEANKTYSGQLVKGATPQRMLLKRNDDASKTLELHQN